MNRESIPTRKLLACGRVWEQDGSTVGDPVAVGRCWRKMMRALKTLGTGVLVGAMVMVSGVARANNEKTSGALAFDQLKALVGEWEGKTAGGPVKITYTLVSGGTALMERMQPANEAEMITMYSADGDKIAMTHYCSEGNQPSLKTDALNGAASKYSFNIVSVSGLKTPDAGHMVGLVLILVDSDHFKQEWKYTDKGKVNTNLFEF